MKKLFIFFILIVLFSCNSKPKSKVADKWQNGANKVVLTYDNPDDTLNYTREYFHANGQLGAKGHFINNKQDGFWEWWFENGNKKDEATFKNGAYVVQRKHWREDGTLEKVEIIKGECLGECCDGKIIGYTEKGIKLVEHTMKNGVENGEGATYFSDGKILRKFTYVNGKKNGMCYEYFQNGQIGDEGNYVDDKEDGQWIWRDSIGKITSKAVFKYGKKNGMGYEYLPNGVVQVEGKYVDGKEEGTWTWRDSTGEIEGYKFYKKGEIISTKKISKH